jgi:glycosyltransferase involved in cell wall biosynthesis
VVAAKMPSQNPRVALVAPYLPAPANTGGRIRIYHLARALARYATVDLFARAWPVELSLEAGDVAPALSVYARREIVLGGPLLLRSVLTSRRVGEASPRALVAALREAHGAAPYAAVVACHAYGAYAAQGLAGAAFVLDEHNIESRYALAVQPSDTFEAGRLRRWERRCWCKADLVTVTTTDDAAHVRTVRTGATEVVPNGVACREIEHTPPSQRRGHTLLFVGAMSHAPNVRAAVELAREVLPRLRRVVPDAHLVLCGRAPTEAVRALASPAVTVTGTVDDVAPWLAKADVYVNLLRTGAGSSLKVAEALAAGVPLVTTAVGARGYALEHGVHALVAESIDDVLRAVLATWNDRGAADVRAARGREFAEALDWDTLGERFAAHVLGVAR